MRTYSGYQKCTLLSFLFPAGGRCIVNNPTSDLKGRWIVTGIRGEIRYGIYFAVRVKKEAPLLLLW